MALAMIQKVLPELAGDIFIGGIFARQFQRDGHQVQTVHGHPAGAIGLLDKAAAGQRLAAVEDADIVQAQEAALEDVPAFGVLAVHPPGEIEQQLVKDALQEGAIAVPRRLCSIL